MKRKTVNEDSKPKSFRINGFGFKKSNKGMKREASNALIFLASMIVTFVFGVAFFAASVFVASWFEYKDGLMSDFTEPSLAVGFLLSLFGLLIVWSIARKGRKYLFIRYASNAVMAGVILHLLVIGINSIGLFYRYKNADSDISSSLCKGIDYQLGNMLSSTYPIGTDLGSGSAFAVSVDGDLVTNYHVIENAKEVYISYANGKVPVEVIGKSEEFDLALLKTTEDTSSFLPLTEKYEVGDEVYIAGYPASSLTAGLATVSKGIVSRELDHSDLKLNQIDAPDYFKLVQTDAAVNAGNSGGPMVNGCGAVGVISAKSDSLNLQDYGVVSEEGISFAVSAKTVAEVFDIELQQPLDQVDSY